MAGADGILCAPPPGAGRTPRSISSDRDGVAAGCNGASDGNGGFDAAIAFLQGDRQYMTCHGPGATAAHDHRSAFRRFEGAWMIHCISIHEELRLFKEIQGKIVFFVLHFF